MIQLLPFTSTYKDLYLETMKLTNKEIEPLQFIVDNFYDSMVHAIYMHTFTELENNPDLTQNGIYNTNEYAKDLYIEAAVDTYHKINDLNKIFNKFRNALDEKLIRYISGQFVNYFTLNEIHLGESELTFENEIYKYLNLTTGAPFIQSTGISTNIRPAFSDICIAINEIIYKSKMTNKNLAKKTGLSLEQIKHLRAGHIKITKDIFHMLFFGLNLTKKEAENFMKQIGQKTKLTLRDCPDERDKYLFNMLDKMIWYKNLPEYKEKHNIEIINLILKNNNMKPLDLKLTIHKPVKTYRTILLTGGLGFIGRNFIKYFNDFTKKYPGSPQYRFCILTSQQNPSDLPENVICYYGRLNNELLYERIFSECEVDYIIHLAAISTISQEMNGLSKAIEVNCQSTVYIYKVIIENNFPIKGIILPSTIRIYRGAPDNIHEYDEQCTIDFQKLKNGYDSSKFIAEIEAQQFAQNEHLPIIITRLSNVYGEGDQNKRLIPEIIKKLANGEKPVLYIDKKTRETETLNFIYIKDLIKAFSSIIELLEEKTYGNIIPKDTYNAIVFNIGSCEHYTVAEITEMIKKIMNKNCTCTYVEGNYNANLKLNIEKAKKIFGFSASTAIQNGLENTVHWYLEERGVKL